jgi:hypothetical protein
MTIRYLCGAVIPEDEYQDYLMKGIDSNKEINLMNLQNLLKEKGLKKINFQKDILLGFEVDYHMNKTLKKINKEIMIEICNILNPEWIKNVRGIYTTLEIPA